MASVDRAEEHLERSLDRGRYVVCAWCQLDQQPVAVCLLEQAEGLSRIPDAAVGTDDGTPPAVEVARALGLEPGASPFRSDVNTD